MYKTSQNNMFKKLALLFVIMILVSLFSIMSYILYMDSKTYVYQSNVVGTKISQQTELISDSSLDIETMLNRATSSIVGISKLKNTGTSVFLEDSATSLGLGTGVIVSENGYIVTNQHVAGDKYSSCYITLDNGNSYSGTVVWADSDLDLAIIKINMRSLPYMDLGDSDNVRIGSTVYAIGNPVGFEFQRTVTSGIVSGTNRTIKVQEGDKYAYMESLIQTDATINEGNSGGPLLNTNGEMIGITSVKITDAEGIGFAIPINIIKPIIEKFLQNGSFEEAYLGIFGYDREVIPYLDSSIEFDKGIYVAEVNMTGPLKNSDIRVGDIIEKIDDYEIVTMSQLRRYIYQKQPGDKVTLTIKRNKREFTIETTLGKRL